MKKSFPGLIPVTKRIWEECRCYNFRFRNKYKHDFPALKPFRWPCWVGQELIGKEILVEYEVWVRYLINLGAPDFDPSVRHQDAVTNRLSNGWNAGEHKDIVKKIDPYLLPFDELPEWLIEMCLSRDKIMLEVLRGCL